LKKREELGRLLRYVLPYKIRLATGHCVSFPGRSGGRPDCADDHADFRPRAESRRPRFQAPPAQEIRSRTSDLFEFLPPAQIHSVGTLFSIAILAVFIGKGLAEYFGNVLVQHAGIAAVTDLRNQVYAKVIRQPIGFFQHHQTGRLMSTVINDVERVRNTFSEYLALGFRHISRCFFLLAVLFATSWKMTLGSVLLLPLVVWPVRTLGKRIRRSTEKIQAGMAS
jgi:ABC-type multidrug transport system fused ATPase/permease subunit